MKHTQTHENNNNDQMATKEKNIRICINIIVSHGGGGCSGGFRLQQPQPMTFTSSAIKMKSVYYSARETHNYY